MIVWDKLTIANANNSSGITVTPVQYDTTSYLDINHGLSIAGSIRHSQTGEPITFESPVYIDESLTLPVGSTGITLVSGNIVGTSSTVLVNSVQTTTITATPTQNGATILRIAPHNVIPARSWFATYDTSAGALNPGLIGQATITTANLTNAQVSGTLSAGQIGTNAAPVSDLYSNKIYLKQQPPISNYSTDTFDDDYKINLRYSDVNLDQYAVLPANNRAGTEYAEMNIVKLFDRIYDIYFMVGGKDDWVTGDHEDGWWFFEAPSELRAIMNAGRIVEKHAYQYEKRDTSNPTSMSLRDYTSQWLVSYFYSYSTNKWYLALGLDSHTNGSWCKISGVGHIRVIR